MIQYEKQSIHHFLDFFFSDENCSAKNNEAATQSKLEQFSVGQVNELLYLCWLSSASHEVGQVLICVHADCMSFDADRVNNYSCQLRDSYFTRMANNPP